MNELALFAGAGGGIQGGQLLGWRTVCAVEFEPYAASVLAARQNDGLLPPFPIWDDVRTFDGRPWKGVVDVVSGGFPCQDISVAGGGKGIDGERSGLWRQMARIVGEVRPTFVFVENSPALTSRGLGVVLGDLAALGYDAEWGVLAASDVGAPHERKRIWILAYSPGFAGNQRRAWIADGCGDVADSELPERRPEREACNGLAREVGVPQREEGAGGPGKRGEDVADSKEQPERKPANQNDPEPNDREARNEFGDDGEYVPHTNLQHVHDPGLRAGEISQQQAARISGVLPDSNQARPQGRDEGLGKKSPGRKAQTGFGQNSSGCDRGDWWATEPDVGRVAHGVAARVDRLKAIGNGQVPECMAEACERLMERITTTRVEYDRPKTART